MCKTKITEWHNELKPTENELKMKIYLLTLYLNRFNENKFMFGRTLKKLFWFFWFLLRHSKVNLRTLTYIFYKSKAPANINSAAFSTFFKKSAFCGTQICFFCCLRQHLRTPPVLKCLIIEKCTKERIILTCEEIEKKMCEAATS